MSLTDEQIQQLYGGREQNPPTTGDIERCAKMCDELAAMQLDAIKGLPDTHKSWERELRFSAETIAWLGNLLRGRDIEPGGVAREAQRDLERVVRLNRLRVVRTAAPGEEEKS